MPTTETANRIPSLFEQTGALRDMGKRNTANAFYKFDSAVTEAYYLAQAIAKRMGGFTLGLEGGRGVSPFDRLDNEGRRFDALVDLIEERRDVLATSAKNEGFTDEEIDELGKSVTRRLNHEATK